MDSKLHGSFMKAGVKEGVVAILVEEELDTVELVENTSDELLRACGVKGGQIVRIRNAVRAYMDLEITPESSTTNDTSSTGSSSSPMPHKSSSTCTLSMPVASQMPRRSLLPSLSTPLSTHSASTPVATSTPKRSLSPSIPSSSNNSTQEHTGTPPTAFSHHEQPISKKNWLSEFHLPSSYSPSVTQALDARCLSGNLRNEFTRDVCSAMRVHTMNPSKTEREQVSFMVIKKYPFLADTIGTGIGSWQTAMKYRFKNLRKTKCQHGSRRVLVEITNQPLNKKKKLDGQIPQLPEGETEDTCKEHTKTLKREMAKTSNKNQVLIKDLMEVTFPYRRKEILTEASSLEAVITKYPALQLISQVKAEFARITEIKNVATKMEDNFKSWKPKLLRFAANTTAAKRTIADMRDLIEEDPEKKSEIEGIASVVVIPLLLKERGCEGAVVKIISDDESIDQCIKETTFPRLIGSGDLSKIDPLYIVVEGRIVATLSGTSVGMPMALVLLMGVFYIFNIEYNPKARNVYAFLETVLLDNCVQAKKRVAVNKLLKDLA